ncbi:MAG: type polyketide synthase, partial [Cyanobacteria bacterium RYN_339]|nr:type polyketide synthase [Cyanobacteria bacterium RYN_339]
MTEALHELLAELKAGGILLGARGDQLDVQAPRGALTPDLRARLALHKPALLAHLAAGTPLSSAQERLWFLDRLAPGSPFYHVTGAFELRGPLDVPRLQAAVDALVTRHEVLRTRYPVSRGTPTAQIDPPGPVSLQAGPPAKDQPFDLATGPVLRLHLEALGPEHHVLHVALHHIAADAWSCGLAALELAALYGGHALPAPTLQYGDFARTQRAALGGAEGDRLLAYWRRALEGAPQILDLPTDRVRPASPSHRGAALAFRLAPPLAERLKALGGRHGATPFMVLLAGFQALLARACGQTDFLVGTPVAGRERRELEPLIGCFINTLALRARLDDDPSLETAVARARDTVVAALAHQQLPFERLVEAMAPPRDPSRAPLFQTMFVFQQPPTRTLTMGELQLTALEPPVETAKFDLTLTAWEEDGGFNASFEYATDLFDPATIEALAAAYVAILAADPDQPSSRLPLGRPAPPAEAALPPARPLPAAFLAHAAAQPDAIALTHGGRHLSYGELANDALGLAARLGAAGAGPGTRIAIALAPGFDQVRAILGVLLTGAAYVPLDPHHPPERHAAIVEDCAPLLTLTDADGHGSYDPRLALDDVAYVIYTSGSSGRPKGVEVTHANLARLFSSFDFHPGDVWTQFHAYTFDFAVWELWGALAHGGRLVLVDPAVARDPAAFWQLVTAEGVTVLNQTPSAFQALAPRARTLAPALRLVVFGGEALEPRTLTPWWQGPNGQGPRLVNMYGITETTVHVTQHPLDPDEPAGRGSPIGFPLPDLTVHLLDRHGQPVPPGWTGEIYVGGAGVARGYLNRPELTAERFVETPAGRLYRSGDLARRDATGALRYLGRADDQVKIRGHRVEPGEVEAALLAHPGIAAAAVLVTVHGGDPAAPVPAGHRRLAAFYVPTAEPPAAGELRAFLRDRLPEPMRPATLTPVPTLPRTVNGKLDREALLRLAPAAEPAPYEAPQTALERDIADGWAELLGVAHVGRDANFFDLGGHSLLLVQAQERLTALVGREIPLTELFQHPTVAALAAHLGGAVEAPLATRRVLTADAIAIVGLAGRFPGAADVDALWTLVREGREGLTRLSPDQLRAAGVPEERLQDPRFVPANGDLAGIDLFDAAFFGYAPAEAALLDPQHRLFLECAWEVLEHAGIDPARPPGPIGVYAGAGASRYLPFHLAARPDLHATAGELGLLLATDKDYVATRAAYELDLRGPAVAVQTACSSSLTAVHQACQALRAGECDVALAGGVAVETRQGQGYMYQPGGIASPDGHCRAFDAAAGGTVGGSGVALVALRRLEDAQADGDTIHAVIRGSAVTNDGAARVGFTAPGVEGQARAIAAALAAAGVEPSTVGYVEAHGTGTPLGDPIEVAALNRAYGPAGGPGTIRLGALKSTIGHLDAAAGVAGLIKATLALRHAELPPNVHAEPSPRVPFAGGPFHLAASASAWPAGPEPRRAGVSAFGLGGTNVHAILEEAPRPSPRGPAGDGTPIFPLSARTPAALQAAFERLQAHLGAQEPRDVAHTLTHGRRAFAQRLAMVGSTVVRAEAKPNRRAAFLLPGLGSQAPMMGQALYAAEPAYRAAIDACAASLDFDLLTALFDPDPATLLRPTRMQPAIFATSYAAARLWEAHGVEPVALLGHSLGEYVAACLAGVFTLADALAIVSQRGRLFEEAGGALLAVTELGELPAGVAVASFNGPGLWLLAGPEAAIAGHETALAARGVPARRPRVPHATHHPLLAPLADRLAAAVAAVPRQAPQRPYLSNVTGDWITAAEAMDPAYWARHLTAPVRYGDALARLQADPALVLVAVGPGRPPGTMVESLVEDFAVARATLWCHGVDAALGPAPGRRIPLPTYPFERRRHWIDADPTGQAFGALPVRRAGLASWFEAPGWRQAPAGLPLPLPVGPWLAVGADGPRARQVVAALRAAGALVIDQGPAPRVLFLGALDLPPGADDETALATGFDALWQLARGWSGGAPRPERLDVVATGLGSLDERDPAVPALAALAGLARALPFEIPGLQVGCIDAPADEDVLAALAGPPEPLVLLRGRRRWLPDRVPLRLPAATPQAETYLITGGSGGVARAIAERLAPQANLVL